MDSDSCKRVWWYFDTKNQSKIIIDETIMS
jgi:hypothetical protein